MVIIWWLIRSAAHSPVVRLISSSHSADDLYGLLIRLALTDDESPSLAARYAISALSYQHLRMETAAITHQGIAIRALQAAIEDCDPSRAMQMMAAGMLLSIFEVRQINYNFVSVDITYHKVIDVELYLGLRCIRPQLVYLLLRNQENREFRY